LEEISHVNNQLFREKFLGPLQNIVKQNYLPEKREKIFDK
jgi:hypothetical protein